QRSRSAEGGPVARAAAAGRLGHAPRELGAAVHQPDAQAAGSEPGQRGQAHWRELASWLRPAAELHRVRSLRTRLARRLAGPGSAGLLDLAGALARSAARLALSCIAPAWHWRGAARGKLERSHAHGRLAGARGAGAEQAEAPPDHTPAWV